MCILLAFMSHMACANEDVSLRLLPSFFDEATQTVYVDVEIRYNGVGHFYLADQNIRLFYDSDQLELVKDHSRSDLPQDLYSSIQWHEVMEHLEADHINQLSFDDELGFVNFSIDLQENKEGGISIAEDHSWQVKVMEWKGPNNIRAAAVDTYIDAAFSTEDEGAAVDLTIYPNPVGSNANFRFEQALTNTSTVRILDMLGREVHKQVASAGIQELRIDLTHLMTGTYQVEVSDVLTDSIISTEQLLKVDN